MCDNNLNVILPNPRDFTDQEWKILNKMLSSNIADKDILYEQLINAKVTGYCSCGCKSIIIAVKDNSPKYINSKRVPVEMLIIGSDGVPVQCLLHIINGCICELEVLRVDSNPINEDLDLENAEITIN